MAEDVLVTYKVGESIYQIPASNQEKLLEKYPDAERMSTFNYGGEDYYIPNQNAEKFISKYPDAEPMDNDANIFMQSYRGKQNRGIPTITVTEGEENGLTSTLAESEDVSQKPKASNGDIATPQPVNDTFFKEDAATQQQNIAKDKKDRAIAEQIYNTFESKPELFKTVEAREKFYDLLASKGYANAFSIGESMVSGDSRFDQRDEKESYIPNAGIDYVIGRRRHDDIVNTPVMRDPAVQLKLHTTFTNAGEGLQQTINTLNAGGDNEQQRSMAKDFSLLQTRLSSIQKAEKEGRINTQGAKDAIKNLSDAAANIRKKYKNYIDGVTEEGEQKKTFEEKITGESIEGKKDFAGISLDTKPTQQKVKGLSKDAREKVLSTLDDIESLYKKFSSVSAQSNAAYVNRPENQYQLATALSEMGKFKESNKILGELLNKNAASYQIYQAAAYNYYQLGDNAAARSMQIAAQQRQPISDIPSNEGGDITGLDMGLGNPANPQYGNQGSPTPASEEMGLIAGALRHYTPLYSNAANISEGWMHALEKLKKGGIDYSKLQQAKNFGDVVKLGVGEGARTALNTIAGFAEGLFAYSMNTTPVGLAFVEGTQGLTAEGAKATIGKVGAETFNYFRGLKGSDKVTPDEAVAAIMMPVTTVLQGKEMRGAEIPEWAKDVGLIADVIAMHLFMGAVSRLRGTEEAKTAQDILDGKEVTVEHANNLIYSIIKMTNEEGGVIYKIQHEYAEKLKELEKTVADFPETREVLQPEIEATNKKLEDIQGTLLHHDILTESSRVEIQGKEKALSALKDAIEKQKEGSAAKPLLEERARQLQEEIDGLEAERVQKTKDAVDAHARESFAKLADEVLDIRFGDYVDYGGIKGRVERRPDGVVVVTPDGKEVLVEGGFSGKRLKDLGLKKIEEPKGGEPKGGEPKTEPQPETEVEQGVAEVKAPDVKFNFEENTVTVDGKKYTYDGVGVDKDGNTTSIRVIDENGNVRHLRNEEVVFEIELQKETAELGMIEKSEVEAAAKELNIKEQKNEKETRGTPEKQQGVVEKLQPAEQAKAVEENKGEQKQEQLKTQDDAVQEQKTKGVDVRQQAADGEAVGERNAKGQEITDKGEAEKIKKQIAEENAKSEWQKEQEAIDNDSSLSEEEKEKKKIESTAKALEDADKTNWNDVSKLFPLKQGVFKERSDLHEAISEAYHKAKADGRNPELVKAVEGLLGKKEEVKTEKKVEKPAEQKQEQQTEQKQETKPDQKPTIEQQVKTFGVAEKLVKPVVEVANALFSGLKKAGLVAKESVEDWLNIGKADKVDENSLDGFIDAVKKELPKVEKKESKIQSWLDKWNKLKKQKDLKELDLFYNKVKVALNGYAQGKGVETEFKELKKDIEDYAEKLKQEQEPKVSTSTEFDTNKQPINKLEDLQDVGEKIGGAKKDLAQALSEVTEDDIKGKPLSKVFPRPDFKKLVAEGSLSQDAAILLNFIYDNIPAKPRKAYRLASWAKTVQGALETTQQVLEAESVKNTDFVDKIRKAITLSETLKRDYEIYSETLKGLGFPNEEVNLGGYKIKIFTRRANKETGNIEDTKPVYSIVKDSFIIKDFDTMEEAINGLKSILNNKGTKAEGTKFDIYQSRKTKEYFIGKKGAIDVVRLVDGFKTVKEARDFLTEKQAELQAMWDAMKAPKERRMANRPRVGTNWRKGENITSNKFQETFGFRGVEFGNWVNNAERQAHVNEAYDALMDLASVLGISPKALSLNGELGFAFGARGSGKFNAHYEAGKVVINLTKTRGAGSLAHEWWHALDNYFSRARNQKTGYITERPRDLINRDGSRVEGVRKEMIDAFKSVMDAIGGSKLKDRSMVLDKTRSEAYWSTPIEMSARSFENYIIEKLAERNQQNDYLANLKSTEEWIKDTGGNIDATKNYPYPLKEESHSINEKFQQFFETIKEDESGKLYQIIGEVGAENLPKIKANLDVARQMEAGGKTPKEIWLATGWERTKDNGKWKYDLPDVNYTERLQNYIDRQGNGYENWDKEFVSKNNRIPKLKDIFGENSELFEAYPELKDVAVVIHPKQSALGTWNTKEKFISVNQESVDNSHNIKSTIIHEIQHAIQDIEGFAKGGNQETAPRLKMDALQDIRSKIKELNIDPYKIQNQISMKYKISDDILDKYRKWQELKELEDGVLAEIVSPYEAYKRLAGEVEARNAQKRLTMAHGQRKEQMLSETEDVAEDSKIYIYGANEVMESRKPFGGNSGYVGYSMSRRAAQAYDEESPIVNEKFQQFFETIKEDENGKLFKDDAVEKSLTDIQEGKTFYEAVKENELTDEQSSELAKEFAESKTLPKKQFGKKDKIANDFDPNDNIDVKPIEKPIKTGKSKIESIGATVSKDEMRPAMQGVFHDAENGRLVTTDAHKLVIIEDKSIKKTEIIEPKTGKPIDAKFPNYDAVIPKDNPIKRKVKVKEWLAQLNGLAESKKFFEKPIAVRIKIGEQEFAFNSELMRDVFNVMAEQGVTEVELQLSQPNRALVIESNKGVMGLVMPFQLREEYRGGLKTLLESEMTISEKNGVIQKDIDYLESRKKDKQNDLKEALSEVRNAKNNKDLSSANFSVEYENKRIAEIDAEIAEKKSQLIDNPLQEKQDLETVKTSIDNGEITSQEATEYVAKPTKRTRKAKQSIEVVESKAESESEVELNEAIKEVDGLISGEIEEVKAPAKPKTNSGIQAQYRIKAGEHIVEALKDFDGSPKAVTAIVHEFMHPTVVEIFNGAKEGNEIGVRHANTIVEEYNKANPSKKVTLNQMIDGNDSFINGRTTPEYRAVQEFIAEAWEKYHHEGAKGFSKAFQEALDAITEAFRQVYKSLTGVTLTPELRKMFDELLGMEEVKQEQKQEKPAIEKTLVEEHGVAKEDAAIVTSVLDKLNKGLQSMGVSFDITKGLQLGKGKEGSEASAHAQFRIDKGKRIVEILKSDLPAKEKATAVLHEVGHLSLHELLQQHIDGSTPEIKKALDTMIKAFNESGRSGEAKKRLGGDVTIEKLIEEHNAFKEQGEKINAASTEALSDNIPNFRDFHEFITDSLNKYLKDGTAGFGKEFDAVLQKIKELLVHVYDTVRGGTLEGLTVSPELKQVFDRMLGKDVDLFKEPEKPQAKPLGEVKVDMPTTDEQGRVMSLSEALRMAKEQGQIKGKETGGLKHSEGMSEADFVAMYQKQQQDNLRAELLGAEDVDVAHTAGEERISQRQRKWKAVTVKEAKKIIEGLDPKYESTNAESVNSLVDRIFAPFQDYIKAGVDVFDVASEYAKSIYPKDRTEPYAAQKAAVATVLMTKAANELRMGFRFADSAAAGSERGVFKRGTLEYDIAAESLKKFEDYLSGDKRVDATALAFANSHINPNEVYALLDAIDNSRKKVMGEKAKSGRTKEEVAKEMRTLKPTAEEVDTAAEKATAKTTKVKPKRSLFSGSTTKKTRSTISVERKKSAKDKLKSGLSKIQAAIPSAKPTPKKGGLTEEPPLPKGVVEGVKDIAEAAISEGHYTQEAIKDYVAEKTKGILDRATSDGIIDKAWDGEIKQKSGAARADEVSYAIVKALKTGKGDAITKQLGEALLMQDAEYDPSSKTKRQQATARLAEILKDPAAAEARLNAAINMVVNQSIVNPKMLDYLGLDPVDFLASKENPHGMTMEQFEAFSRDMLKKKLYDMAQDFMGHGVHEQRVLPLPKKRIKPSASEVKKFIKDFYDNPEMTDSMLETALTDHFDITPEQATAIASKVRGELADIVASRSQKKIDALAEEISDGDRTKKKRVTDMVVKALTTNGAFGDIPFSEKMAAALSNRSVAPADINKILAYGRMANATDSSLLKAFYMRKAATILSKYDMSAASFLFQGLYEQGVVNILGNPRTSILTASLSMLKTMPFDVARMFVTRPSTFVRAVRFSKLIGSKGIGSVTGEGFRAILNGVETVRNRAEIETKPQIRRESANKQARLTSWRYLRKASLSGNDPKRAQLFILKALQSLTFSGGSLRQNIGGKTYEFSPTHWLVNLISGLDVVVKAGLMNLHNYYNAERFIRESGIKFGTSEFTKKMSEMLTTDPLIFDAIDKQVNMEVADAMKNGIPLPKDYVHERKTQLYQEYVDKDVVSQSLFEINKSALIGIPRTWLGAHTYNFIRSNTEIKDNEKTVNAAVKYFFGSALYFSRVGINVIERRGRGIPFYNMFLAAAPYEFTIDASGKVVRRTTESGKVIRRVENKRDFAFGILQATTTTALAVMLINNIFQQEDLKDEKGNPVIDPATGEPVKHWVLNPSSPIRFHGRKKALTTTEKNAVPAMCIELTNVEDPDKRFWKFEWFPESWYPMLFMLGEESDDIRYKEEKLQVGGTEKDNSMLRSVQEEPTSMLRIVTTAGIGAFNASFTTPAQTADEASRLISQDKKRDAAATIAYRLTGQPFITTVNPRLAGQIADAYDYFKEREKTYVKLSIENTNIRSAVSNMAQYSMNQVWAGRYLVNNEDNKYTIYDAHGQPMEREPGDLLFLPAMFSEDMYYGWAEHIYKSPLYKIYMDDNGNFDESVIAIPNRIGWNDKVSVSDMVKQQVRQKTREYYGQLVTKFYGKLLSTPYEERGEFIKELWKAAVNEAKTEYGAKEKTVEGAVGVMQRKNMTDGNAKEE